MGAVSCTLQVGSAPGEPQNLQEKGLHKAGSKLCPEGYRARFLYPAALDRGQEPAKQL